MYFQLFCRSATVSVAQTYLSILYDVMEFAYWKWTVFHMRNWGLDKIGFVLPILLKWKLGFYFENIYYTEISDFGLEVSVATDFFNWMQGFHDIIEIY